MENTGMAVTYIIYMTLNIDPNLYTIVYIHIFDLNAIESFGGFALYFLELRLSPVLLLQKPLKILGYNNINKLLVSLGAN